MSAEKQRKDDARPADSLRIEGEMTIYQAAELKQTLLAALEQCDELTIDLSAVTEIDTSGMQLLVAARGTAQARRKTLSLTAHSDAVVAAFELLDLGAWFGDPLVVPARTAASHS